MKAGSRKEEHSKQLGESGCAPLLLGTCFKHKNELDLLRMLPASGEILIRCKRKQKTTWYWLCMEQVAERGCVNSVGDFQRCRWTKLSKLLYLESWFCSEQKLD